MSSPPITGSGEVSATTADVGRAIIGAPIGSVEIGTARPRQERVWLSNSSCLMVRKSGHIEQRKIAVLSGCTLMMCLLRLCLLGPSRTFSHPGWGHFHDLAAARGRFGWPRGALFTFLLCGSSMLPTEESSTAVVGLVSSKMDGGDGRGGGEDDGEVSYWKGGANIMKGKWWSWRAESG
jgi:hypothetical protein